MIKTKKPGDITAFVLNAAKKSIVFRFIVALLYRSMAMTIPIFFSLAVNNITNGNYKRAVMMAVIALALVIIFRVFDVVATYAWHNLYNVMYNTYTEIGIKKTLHNSLYSLSRINMGEFLNIMTSDINIMCDFYCNLIMRLIRVLEVTVIFVYFFMINLYIGLAGLVVAAVSLTIIFLSSPKVEELNRVKSYEGDKRGSVLNEFLLCIRDIKSFNISAPIEERIKAVTNKFVVSILKQRVGEDVFRYSMVMFIEIFRWCLFIYGIFLISKGKMEIGTLLIIYNYYTQLVDGFSEFAVINVGIRQLRVSERRFFKLAEYSREDYKLESTENSIIKGTVVFENILHGYKDNPVLNRISFEVKSGTIFCIVGKKGSGKTGIVDLLLRLNTQHEGTIKIDNNDIRDINTNEYYNLISSINDKYTFFNVSIKENLEIVRDNFKKSVSICEQLGIHNDIVTLKDGYDTILNSKDDTLKSDVKKLLCVAKILLKNTKIMIFDDIFERMDKNASSKILDILSTIKKDHTIIIITKDETILEKSDEVLLIDNGKVLLSGTHAELYKVNSTYTDIVNS